MLKQAMFGVVFGLAVVPAMAAAGVTATPAKIIVRSPTSMITVVTLSGQSSPVSMLARQGKLWKGFQGTVQDLSGKAVSYHFEVNNAYSAKTMKSVHGLAPLRDGVATITLRNGIPAVKG